MKNPTEPPVQVVTTAPESADGEQRSRITHYLIAMGIRTVCFLAAVLTDGWVRWTCVAFAVFLPYLAVVAANAVRPRALGQVSDVTPRSGQRRLSS